MKDNYMHFISSKSSSIFRDFLNLSKFTVDAILEIVENVQVGRWLYMYIYDLGDLHKNGFAHVYFTIAII